MASESDHYTVFGSGMGKNQDPGSGINIPDPPHWQKLVNDFRYEGRTEPAMILYYINKFGGTVRTDRHHKVIGPRHNAPHSASHTAKERTSFLSENIKVENGCQPDGNLMLRAFLITYGTARLQTGGIINLKFPKRRMQNGFKSDDKALREIIV
jgi:hypothetical protein